MGMTLIWMYTIRLRGCMVENIREDIEGPAGIKWRDRGYRWIYRTKKKSRKTNETLGRRFWVCTENKTPNPWTANKSFENVANFKSLEGKLGGENKEDTEHYLVVTKFRERLTVSKRATQKSDV